MGEFFIAIVTVTLGLFGEPAEAASNCASVTDANVVECAAEFDPLKNEQPRPDLYVKGGHRTPLGMQIHPSCFEFAAAEAKKNGDASFSEEQARTNLDAVVKASFVSIMGSCAARFPALRDKYLRAWVAQARRTVMTCSPETLAENSTVAFNPPSIGSLASALPESSIKGIPLKGNTFTSLAQTFQPVIAFKSDAFASMAAGNGGPVSGMIDTLAHEIFHSTGANNQPKHDKVQGVAALDKNICDTNVLDDRVMAVTAACTGVCRPQFHESSFFEQIEKRRAACGKERGCTELFTKNNYTMAKDLFLPLERKYTPSEPLSEKDAAGLCCKFEDEGRCSRHVRENRDDILKALKRKPDLGNPSTISEMTVVGEKVSRRLDAVLPRTDNDIPMALIKTYPHLYDELLAVKHHPCFDAVFVGWPEDENKPGAALTMRNWKLIDFSKAEVPSKPNFEPKPGSKPKAFVAPGKDEVLGGTPLSPSTRGAIHENWRSCIGQSPYQYCGPLEERSQKLMDLGKCSHATVRQRLSDALASLRERLSDALSSPAYADQVSARVPGSTTVEKLTLSPAIFGLVDLARKNEALAALVNGGAEPDLYARYQEALAQHHPDSPRFNCEKAGLALCSLGGKVRALSEELKLEAQRISCP